MLKSTLSFGLSLSLASCLLAGCAATSEAPDDAEPTSALGAETHWSGGFRYYDWAFDCKASGLVNSVKPKSRRHVYGFTSDSGGETTFTLDATWPKQLGAFLMVLDAQGGLVDWTYQNGNQATLAAKLPSAGDYWVFVSPVYYEKLKTSHAYSLTAACPKDMLCAEYTTSDGRFYAKNFPASDAALANQWVTLDPQVESSGVGPGTCESQNAKPCPTTDPPVCGVPISTDQETTYASLCEFRKVVRAAAGSTGESKGKFWNGACPDGYCAVGWISPPDVNSPTVYVKNFETKGEAESWLGSSLSNLTSSEIRDGHCDEPVACLAVYKPVCGTIKSGAAKTYSNSCSFQGAVMGDAGSAGESKGFYTPGACAPACDYSDPSKTWVAKSAEQCMLVKYYCTPPTVPFSNACGCGCQS